MTLTRTMNTGVTGLRAQEQALGVVGDNIANINTFGFKRSRAVFEDVLGSVSGGGAGAGTRMTRAQQIFGQGALQNTGVPTDLALSGEGFFVVEGTVDGTSGQFFTRNGQMSIRSDGALVNSSGLEVQGYVLDASGTKFVTQLGPVELAPASLPPRPTDTIEMTANLDPSATTPALPFDVNDPVNTSNFSTSITAYDSMGNAHSLDVYFIKGANPNEWDVRVMGDATEVTSPPPANAGDANTEVASGTVTFDGTGKLQTLTAMSATIGFGSAAPQTVDFNFGDPIATGGTGGLGLTQYGAPSSVSSQSQNGYPPGDLTGVDITSDGVVNGLYSNGQSIAIAQLAIAKFQANEGLARSGSNLWMQTRDSGEPAIGAASTGGRAGVVSGALEQSTVDLTAQFVDMISFQRAFSANAKTITTADEMLVEIQQLKR